MEADLFTVLGNIAFIERQRERLHLVDNLGKVCEVAESRSNGFLIYDNTGSTRRRTAPAYRRGVLFIFL